jgi:hypothetical protein
MRYSHSELNQASTPSAPIATVLLRRLQSLQFWPWQDRVRCADDAGEAFEPSGAGHSSDGAIEIR